MTIGARSSAAKGPRQSGARRQMGPRLVRAGAAGGNPSVTAKPWWAQLPIPEKRITTGGCSGRSCRAVASRKATRIVISRM